jgi:hypothetical protein
VNFTNDNTEKSFKEEDERSWNKFIWHGKRKRGEI